MLQAKAERHAFKKKIKSCEEQLRKEQAKLEQVCISARLCFVRPSTAYLSSLRARTPSTDIALQEEIRFQVDREIFAKILKVRSTANVKIWWHRRF